MIKNIFLSLLLTPLLAAEKKPNIVLIMTDDAGWECFGSYGAEDYQTPHLDRLAAEGVKFEHCYSTPICTPSRVMIMTGKYNFRNYTYFGYLNPEEKTFGHLLKQAGYQTAIAGKWQLNGIYDPKVFEDHLDNKRPYQAGFDEYALWQLTKQKSGERFWSPPLEINGKFLTVEQNQDLYGPDIMSDFVCDFIERNQDKPFFVYYPTVLVHDPFVPTPDSIGDRPRGQQTNIEPKSLAQKKMHFVEMVNYLDKIVGKVVAKLEAVGQLENTLILFTSDNGTHKKIQSQWDGRLIRGGKGGMKDHGTHVPLIAYWKGKSVKGLACQDLVDFTDVYATLAAVAGIQLDATDPKDGQSFLPQLLGQPTTPRTHVLCHYQPYWHNDPGAFVRNDQFKLYADGQFYDIAKDLDEAENLAGSLKGVPAITAYQKLKKLIDQVPPVPSGGRKSRKRPIYPDWPLVK